MLRKAKIDRRAGEAERDRARQWVELYRLAASSPNGRHCLNPEDVQEEHAYIYADDPGPLLSLLEGFAKHGSFFIRDTYGIPEMILREELKVIRAGGKSYIAAIADMAEKYHCSPSKIERAVKLPSKRDTD